MLNSDDIQLLKDDWIPAAEANDELPISSFKQAVSWAEDVENGSANTQAEVYGVFCSEGRIHAIFDQVGIHLGTPKGYFKILSMVVAPQIDLSGIKADEFFSARDRFAAVIAKVITHGMNILQSHENATKVKFYASGSVTLGLFQKTWASLDPDILEQLNVATNVYGNWAEFSKI
ncbi:hypothetical protein [Vreelandella glaciei]|nr:hypothetical protein [Halomonas glaciei]